MKFLLIALLLSATTFAQPCKTSDDLLSINGSLKGHTKTPIGGGSFTASEKPVAMKILIAAENLCKKNFLMKGGGVCARVKILRRSFGLPSNYM